MKNTETGYFQSSVLAYEDGKESVVTETNLAGQRPSKLVERRNESIDDYELKDEVQVEVEEVVVPAATKAEDSTDSKNGQTTKTPRLPTADKDYTPTTANNGAKDDNGQKGQKLVADKSDQKTNLEPFSAGIRASKSFIHTPQNEINVGSHLINENSILNNRLGTDVEGS